MNNNYETPVAPVEITEDAVIAETQAEISDVHDEAVEAKERQEQKQINAVISSLDAFWNGNKKLARSNNELGGGMTIVKSVGGYTMEVTQVDPRNYHVDVKQAGKTVCTISVGFEGPGGHKDMYVEDHGVPCDTTKKALAHAQKYIALMQ